MYLILTIVLTTCLYLAFKSFERLKIDTFQAIVFNYIICVITGTIFSGGPTIFTEITPKTSWVVPAIVLGSLFISTFYLMAYTAQKVSVALSTVASKISLIIPVLFSLFIFQQAKGAFTIINYVGLTFILAAIFLITYKKEQRTSGKGLKSSILIIAIFLCTGAIDTLLNYTQMNLTDETLKKVFPIILFLIAASLGGIVLVSLLVQGKQRFQWKNLLGGIYLGVPNYFSIYFLIKALENNHGDGASVFPIVNISVIILSSISALFIFRERLHKINYLGIILAVFGITCISWQNIFN